MPYVLLSINKNDFEQISRLLKGAYRKQDVEYAARGGAAEKDEALIFEEEITRVDYLTLQSILVYSLEWGEG
ncbi:MAG: hypothetical protein QME59_01955 [Candidatus Hydrothermarchaeota archaeon]|nr:hypothetical protein [Candidatus Hydrothermarchaeota archaeon]